MRRAARPRAGHERPPLRPRLVDASRARRGGPLEAQRGIALAESCGDGSSCGRTSPHSASSSSRRRHCGCRSDPETAGGSLASSGWREPNIYGELPMRSRRSSSWAARGGSQAAGRTPGPREPNREPWGEAGAGRCEELILTAEETSRPRSQPTRSLAVHERLLAVRPRTHTARTGHRGRRGHSAGRHARRSSARSRSSRARSDPVGRQGSSRARAGRRRAPSQAT